MKKVIVIGGGAAGMAAAIFAARSGVQAVIYEKSEKLGKKVYITGKGRCNVTNACAVEELFDNVISNPRFLYSAFYSFDNRALMELLEQAGCKLKIERGERVFPVSDRSSDVIKALKEELKRQGVTIHLNTPVKELWLQEQELKGVILLNGMQEQADSVIVATGGLSYPTTGSTGDGYRMARQLGHEVTELSPALVPMNIKEACCQELQGLALKNVGAKLLITGENGIKRIHEDFGEMLFTHFGVSGPLILSASSYLAKSKCRQGILRLDLKPALTEEQLDKRVLRDFEENRNKQFKNAVGGLFPVRLIPVMIKASGIDAEKKVYDITKEERKHFVHLIKNWELTVQGLREYAEAVITQGGISVKEVNPSTMESRKVKNLYFAGEVLDVDALTGGFNLQIAWSTGYLAGVNCVT